MKHYLLRYLKQPKLYLEDRRRGVVIARSANARKCAFEGKNKIYEYATVMNASIGRGTYIGPRSKLDTCKIGRYCSIGPDVLVLPGAHPLDGRLSTHPCFYSTLRQAGFTYVDQQSFDEISFCDSRNEVIVEIGSDVWIGARVIIVGGVKIGHGAVIAAGSIVTKDVEAYSIVAGVPAKHSRYRFEEAKRTECLRVCWWERDEVWITSNLSKFERPG